MSNPIGATGKQVASNIKRLRGAMQYKELAEKLEAIGRPLSPVAIRDAENGKRKVDVDDLMAFAIVFGVSPLTLLLPASGSRHVQVKITGCNERFGSNVVWLWARGDEPLEVPSDSSASAKAIAEYRDRAVPSIEERFYASNFNGVPLEDLLAALAIDSKQGEPQLMQTLIDVRQRLQRSQGVKE